MAGSSSPTRSEIRASAFRRLGINRDGDAPNRLVDLVNESIKSAHTKMYKKFHWVRRRVVINQTLVDNQTVLAIPENTKPGLIEHTWFESTNGNATPRIVELTKVGSITPQERYTASLGTVGTQDQVGPPRIWWVENDEIHIGGPAGGQWTEIFFQYQEKELPVREDTDFIQIDEELMVMQAVLACKKWFQEDTKADREDIDDYIEDLRGVDGDDEDSTLIFGGMRSISTRKQPYHDRISGFYGGQSRGGTVGPDGRIWPNGGPYA